MNYTNHTINYSCYPSAPSFELLYDLADSNNNNDNNNKNIVKNHKGIKLYEKYDCDDCSYSCLNDTKQLNSKIKIKSKSKEKLINSINNINDGLNCYPFNLKLDTNSNNEINNIMIKLNNTTINLNDNFIGANKSILFEIVNDTLKIWENIITENRIMTTKGSSIVIGYNINDFDGNKIKIKNKISYLDWNIDPNTKINIKNIKIIGSNNNFIINNTLSNDINMNIRGKNNINIKQNDFEKLTLKLTHGNIDFNDSKINNLNLNMEGNGIVNNLTCVKGNITIIGDGIIYINKDAIINKKIYGGGKIVML